MLTLKNGQNDALRGYDQKASLPLFEQTRAIITGSGYSAERAEFNGLSYFNTSLKGDGDLYQDPHSHHLPVQKPQRQSARHLGAW